VFPRGDGKESPGFQGSQIQMWEEVSQAIQLGDLWKLKKEVQHMLKMERDSNGDGQSHL